MAIALPKDQHSPSSAPLPLSHIPDHVAIIMDGNGRWARARGRPRLSGHRAGTENLRRVIERFADCGVSHLTLYAFSTENWNRPKREVTGLMTILSHYLKREIDQLHRKGIRLLHIGHLGALNSRLQRQIRDAIELTKDNHLMSLTIAFNYGGRAEIVDAVRRIVADDIPSDQIDESLIRTYLSTTSQPDPDLVIRTAGEMRISNFLLWQGAYAEFYTTPVYWPDFDIHEIDEALITYTQRKRRFGGLLPEEVDYPTPPRNGSPDDRGHNRRNGQKP